MAIASSPNRMAYTGNGSTDEFAFPYPFRAKSDLVVTLDGTAKVEGTHYTISGTADANGGYSSGTVSFEADYIPASGVKLVILRKTSLDQEVDFAAGDAFLHTSVNAALDKLTLQVQDIDARLNRALRLAEYEAGIAAWTVAERKGKYPYFDPTTGAATLAASAALAAITGNLYQLGGEKRRSHNITEYPYLAQPNATVQGDADTPGTIAHTTAAIEAACAAAALDGLPVYIPGGATVWDVDPAANVYSAFVCNQVSITASCRIIGDGPSSIIRLAPDQNTTLFKAGDTGEHLLWLEIDGVWFDGDWENNHDYTPGVYLFNANVLRYDLRNWGVVRSGGGLCSLDYDGGDEGRLGSPRGLASRVLNFTIKNALHNGLVIDNITDAFIAFGDISNASQAGYETAPVPDGEAVTAGSYHNFILNVGLKLLEIHSHTDAYVDHPDGEYRPAIRPLTALYLTESEIDAASCHFEGAQVVAHFGHGATAARCSACRFYGASAEEGVNGPTILIEADDIHLANCTLVGPFPPVSSLFEQSRGGIQLGSASHPVDRVTILGGGMENLLEYGVDWTHAGDNCRVEMTRVSCGDDVDPNQATQVLQRPVTKALALYAQNTNANHVEVRWNDGFEFTLTPALLGTPDTGKQFIYDFSNSRWAFDDTLQVMAATAAAPGGTAGKGIMLGPDGQILCWGTGAPTLSAGINSIYIRFDAPDADNWIYRNTNGTTGWAAGDLAP